MCHTYMGIQNREDTFFEPPRKQVSTPVRCGRPGYTSPKMFTILTITTLHVHINFGLIEMEKISGTL